MGRRYQQLGLAERIEICRLRADGKSLRAIARTLDRSAATISRELRRNSEARRAWRGGYDPARAQRLADRRRRWDCRFKLARQPDLRDLVRQRLAMGLSPEQIAGRLARDHGRTLISHEAIYRFIYHRSAQKDYWHRLLPRRQPRRGRLVLLARQIGKTAETLVASLLAQLARIPPPLRRTVTFDNGTEFALHYQLTDELGIQTYFCDVRAPWQKGGVENAIGRLRRHLPRKTILPSLSDEDLRRCAQRYNDTPRKCLGFQTPAEVFSKLQTVALQS